LIACSGSDAIVGPGFASPSPPCRPEPRLTHLKLNKIRMLEPGVPIVRHELLAPGDLLHFDIKKLAHIHKPSHRSAEYRVCN
jgi:hypothetical protein